MDEKNLQIKPESEFQEKYLSCVADILIGGGSAGGGKTFSLLMDPLRNIDHNEFGGVIFRRTTPQIRNEGGLWDTSESLYASLGAEPKESTLEWVFPSGASMKFTHLEHEKDKFNHQGAQYPWIGFDELTHFTKGQFFYLMTRNRSPHGFKPCIRATCNPDPDSWVASFIEWWINPETGFPIPERDGVLRFFTIDSGHIVWGNTVDEVVNRCPHIFQKQEFKEADVSDLVKSVTFIRGSIYNNKVLLKNDPSYLASLLAQDEEIKGQLLEGNWKLVQDNLAICDYQKINDIFTNFVDQYETLEEKFILDENGKKIKKKQSMYITCDAARFGRDLAVIYVWEGFKVIKIIIFTKCGTDTQRIAIEGERELYNIPKSHVLVDQDGVGGGVVDEGGYVGFSGNSSVIDTKIITSSEKYKPKENYKLLKDQCWYKMADRINNAGIQICLDDVWVDGKKTNTVIVGKKIYDIESLIKQDLRCYKREKSEMDGKKQINPKEAQKNILKGRSPDNGDTIMMREFFELKPKKEFIFEEL